jgi:hypothetical protein
MASYFTIRLFSACNKVEEAARAGSPVPSTSTEADEPSSPTLATPFIESLIKYSHIVSYGLTHRTTKLKPSLCMYAVINRA